MKYLITGFGLIGRKLTDILLKNGDQIVLVIRNIKKIDKRYSEKIRIIEQDIIEPIKYTLQSENDKIDFVIHTAAPTASSFFIDRPIETIKAIIRGSENVFDFSMKQQVKSIVWLSSMESYGKNNNDQPITEKDNFLIDINSMRSSYPLAKRMVENLASAYFKEYNLPIKTARLVQVIPDILNTDDNRVVSYMARAIKIGDSIKLASQGSSKRTYISADDAVRAIIKVLHDGKDGEIYNISNNATYYSIKEIAEMLIEKFNGKKLIVGVGDSSGKYPAESRYNVISNKLMALGWQPEDDIIAAFSKLINERDE